MPRIQGVDLPNGKPTYISLRYLYGVGRALAIEICRTLGIDPCIKASELTEDEIARINNLLDKDPPTIANTQLGLAYDAANADPLGRYVSVGFVKRW